MWKVPGGRAAFLARMRVRDYFRNMNRNVIDSYSPEELAIVRRFIGDMLRNTRDKLRDARLSGTIPGATPK